jgi:ABC-type maltose transport system permease subunit
MALRAALIDGLTRLYLVVLVVLPLIVA